MLTRTVMIEIPTILSAVPRHVLELCEQLAKHGFRGWLVGGSVRDELARQIHETQSKPSDWDVATSATPDQVQRIFRRVIPTGIAHGTVTVLMGGDKIEVTTLRGESGYSDGRHPDEVTFVDSIVADLARRDFTVNAIAFDPLNRELIDPFGGVADLQARKLRAVGEPSLRFEEDGLRVLRAARFAATLEFDIAPETLAAIRPSLASYQKVSPERIRDEWLKGLAAKRPSRAFQIMLEHGLLEHTAPELQQMHGCTQNRHHAYDVWTHTMYVVDGTPANRVDLRLAALLHDVGKPSSRSSHPTTGDFTFYHHECNGAQIAEGILRRLRFSNETRERVTELVRHHLVVYEPTWTDATVRRWLKRVSMQAWRDVIILAHADVRGKGRDVAEDIVRLEELTQHAERVIEAGAALSIRDLALSGGELIRELRITPGPVVGRLLRQLLEDVVEAPEHNQRERLLERAQELLVSFRSAVPSSSSSGSP